MNKDKQYALPCLTILFAAATTAHAATWYVATNGNDGNPGTQAQPFEHISYAVNASADGDTIILADGTYWGSSNTGFTFNKAVRITSSGGPANCIIDALYAGHIWGLGTAVTVDGLTLTNSWDVSPAILCSADGTIVRNCIITNCNDSGNFARGGAMSITGATRIDNCAFSNCVAFRGGGAIYTEAPTTITNCVFDTNSAPSNVGGAIYSYYGPTTISNCVFRANQARTGAALYHLQDGGCSHCGPVPGCQVTNCVFFGNTATTAGGAGIDGGPYTDTNACRLTNCVLYGNTAAGSPSDLHHYSATYSCVGSGDTAGTGNTTANPQFVSATDFHLQANSPCRNAGSISATALPGLDLAGAPRWVEGTPDMGVYEYIPTNSIFVDRFFLGSQSGTMTNPYTSVGAALASYSDAAPRSIYMRPANYPEGTPSLLFNITKAVSIYSWGGAATLGRP